MALSKLFERIFFHNNTTPALNEDNLNAMSKAIDDIDDRVIDLGADVMEAVPELQQMIEEMGELSNNPPYIGANGNWYVYNTSTGEYEDSGVDASITLTIRDVTMLAEGATPYVTNTGTNTDPIFHLFIPIGASGADGISPGITITTITGGHRITITDATHPSGQSFDVMDGDMQSSIYDPNGDVATAGGIVEYIDDVITDALTASY